MLKTLHSDSIFLVVQDSSLNPEVDSAFSSQICFFAFGISLGILPVQKIVFNVIKLAQLSNVGL